MKRRSRAEVIVDIYANWSRRPGIKRKVHAMDHNFGEDLVCKVCEYTWTQHQIDQLQCTGSLGVPPNTTGTHKRR